MLTLSVEGLHRNYTYIRRKTMPNCPCSFSIKRPHFDIREVANNNLLTNDVAMIKEVIENL
jgi:hypothetical protein